MNGDLMIYVSYIIIVMRILVDIPPEELKLVTEAAKRLEISRAEFIRRAIASSLIPHRKTMDHGAFGLWSAHAVDGLEYQRKMREEW